MALNPSINPYPLGKIAPTSGTAVSLVDNTSETKITCNSILIQGLGGNSNDVYIGADGMNRGTLAGVICLISPGESISINGGEGPNPFDVGMLFADVDTTGDAVLVSIIIK